MAAVSNKHRRPVYLNLLRIRLPVAGVVSILHRISGVLLVLALPPLFYLLQRSLESETGYRAAQELFGGMTGRLVLAGLVWLAVEHLLSGVRHLLLDIDVGISRRASAWSARLVLAASIALTLWLVAPS